MCKFRVKNQVGWEDGSSGTCRAAGWLGDQVRCQAKIERQLMISVTNKKRVPQVSSFRVLKMFPPGKHFSFFRICFPLGNIFGKNVSHGETFFGKTKNVSHRETFF